MPTQFWDKFGYNMVVVTYSHVLPNINDISIGMLINPYTMANFSLWQWKRFFFLYSSTSCILQWVLGTYIAFSISSFKLFSSKCILTILSVELFLKTNVWVFFPTLIELHFDSLFQPFPSINFCNDVALYHKLVVA